MITGRLWLAVVIIDGRRWLVELTEVQLLFDDVINQLLSIHPSPLNRWRGRFPGGACNNFRMRFFPRFYCTFLRFQVHIFLQIEFFFNFSEIMPPIIALLWLNRLNKCVWSLVRFLRQACYEIFRCILQFPSYLYFRTCLKDFCEDSVCTFTESKIYNEPTSNGWRSRDDNVLIKQTRATRRGDWPENNNLSFWFISVSEYCRSSKNFNLKFCNIEWVKNRLIQL